MTEVPTCGNQSHDLLCKSMECVVCIGVSTPHPSPPSHLLKVTKFLVKISQFEFLIMIEESILVYKLFLSLNILDFSLRFVLQLQSPMKKSPPPLSQQPPPPPPSKNWGPVKPLRFENLVGGLTLPKVERESEHYGLVSIW